MISPDLICDFKEMIVDEQKDYALTKISKRNDDTQITHSDHNVMLTKFSMSWNKDEKRQKKFSILKTRKLKKDSKMSLLRQ